ncbi:uncharacterized protein LOC108696211 isoform X2 [Xenopus laevis]|uniref:Uncharacterized protein LOC108696211 isoform X2 n=1 Tax=Xenopus laevis TaxID=8355 RepID=A0A8J1L800_XENLA|nr:uncharacterized protein LOC108696211 isoform X2 [Xenopus laevis]
MEKHLEEEIDDVLDLDQAPVMRSWGSLMDLREGENSEGEPTDVEEKENDKLDQAPVMRSWGSLMDLQNGEQAEGEEPSAKDCSPQLDLPHSEVKEEKNDDKTDPASVMCSGSVTDLLIEKEQEVEADNIDKEKSDVLPTKSDTDSTKSEDKGAVGKNTIIFQNTTRVWKPKLRRPTFVNQNFTPSLKKGEIEHPTADTTKADYGPVNCTPRCKNAQLERPTADTTKADYGPVNCTPRCKNAQLERPTADTTKADYGPVKRKRKMSNINMEERVCLPTKRKTGHINMDERGGMPKNMDERGGMPKDMDERGGMPKKRKITFEKFTPKREERKRERQHHWNHPQNHTGKWKKNKQAWLNNGFFTWNKPTVQVTIEMRPERSFQQKWSWPKSRSRFRPY